MEARGMMALFIILNKIKDLEEIKLFDIGGYINNDKMSGENEYVFIGESPK